MSTVSTYEPRVELPTTEFAPVPVAVKLDNFARLHQARDAAQRDLMAADRAVLDGQVNASQALADALLNETTPPRRTAATLEDKAKVAEAVWQAHRVAVDLAHRQLAAAVAENAVDWAAQVAVVHRAAEDRLVSAVAEVLAASDELTITGGLLMMLSTAPTSLTTGHWLPAAYLSALPETLAEAVGMVAQHTPTMPEPVVEVDAEPAVDAA